MTWIMRGLCKTSLMLCAAAMAAKAYANQPVDVRLTVTAEAPGFVLYRLA